MPSYSRLHNIFTLNPKDFQMVPVGKDKKPAKSWRIGMVGGDKAVSFYVTGRVANSALSLEGETKSISIQVIERFWPRIASFLATVLNIDVLLVPVKDGGICFSSFKQGRSFWHALPRSFLTSFQVVQIGLLVLSSLVKVETDQMFALGRFPVGCPCRPFISCTKNTASSSRL